MKTAFVYSVCECQARLGAELDESRVVLRGFARDPKRGEELVAPANAVHRDGKRFDVGWMCPICTRNVLRMFDVTALAFRDRRPTGST
jgi:hypothetical protein